MAVSRSRRKTPIFGFTCAESEKRDKVIAHRRERRAVRVAIASDADLLPVTRDVSNENRFAKDGKHWSGGLRRSKWMRK